jgi:hypothetical protein
MSIIPRQIERMRMTFTAIPQPYFSLSFPIMVGGKHSPVNKNGVKDRGGSSFLSL